MLQSISPSVMKNWKTKEYSGEYQMLTFFMYFSSGYCWLTNTHTDIVGIYFVFLVIVINTLNSLEGRTWSCLLPWLPRNWLSRENPDNHGGKTWIFERKVSLDWGMLKSLEDEKFVSFDRQSWKNKKSSKQVIRKRFNLYLLQITDFL